MPIVSNSEVTDNDIDFDSYHNVFYKENHEPTIQQDDELHFGIISSSSRRRR